MPRCKTKSQRPRLWSPSRHVEIGLKNHFLCPLCCIFLKILGRDVLTGTAFVGLVHAHLSDGVLLNASRRPSAFSCRVFVRFQTQMKCWLEAAGSFFFPDSRHVGIITTSSCKVTPTRSVAQAAPRRPIGLCVLRSKSAYAEVFVYIWGKVLRWWGEMCYKCDGAEINHIGPPPTPPPNLLGLEGSITCGKWDSSRPEMKLGERFTLPCWQKDLG